MKKLLLFTIAILLHSHSFGQQWSDGFGLNGKVKLELAERSSRGQKIALLNDGSLLVAVNSDISQSGALLDRNFYIYKLNADGSVDANFATNGYYFQAAGAGDQFSYVFSLSYSETDHAIYVLANVQGARKLLRLNSNGTIHTAFGTNGAVDATDYYNLTLQDDSKIVLLGMQHTAPYTHQKFKRILNDGTADNTFGVNGVVVQDLTIYNYELIGSAKVQNDQKLVVVGYSYDSTESEARATIARYNANGTLDLAFGSNGYNITNIGTEQLGVFMELDIDANGKIIAAGYNMHPGGTGGWNGNKSVLAQYDPNGNLMPGFGDSGIKIFNSVNGANDHFRSVKFLSDGSIIAGGSSGSSFPSLQSYYYMTKVDAHGVIDNTFFDNGNLVSNFDNGITNTLFDISVNASDEIFGIGLTRDITDSHFIAVIGKIDNNTFGVDEHGTDGLAIYPNPVSGIVNIRSEHEIGQINLYSVTGARVLQQTHTQKSKQLSLNLEAFTTGVYLLKITNTDGTQSNHKIFKI